MRQLLMRLLGTSLLCSALMLLAGCEPIMSLHPFYTEQQGVFEPGLLGTWVLTDDGGKEQHVRFERADEGSYRVLLDFADDPGNGRFRATLDGRLVRLGDERYLDLVQNKKALDENPTFYVLPFHTIYRLRLSGDGLEMAYFDDDKIAAQIESGKLRIAHEQVNGDILLTAGPEELQKLAREHPETLEPLKPLRRQR
jgi:hypothetical protein